MQDFDIVPYEGEIVDGYTGFGDDDVEFGSTSVDFKNEIGSAKTFTVVVTNRANTVKRVGLGAAIEAVNGVIALADGSLDNENIEVSASPKPYNLLKEFIRFNPSRLVTMKIQSNNEAQLAQSIFVTHSSPFEVSGSRNISIASYTNENGFNTKMATLRDLELQLDNQTNIAIDIPGAVAGVPTQTVLTLYIGAIYNIAKGLNKRANRAKLA
jgi:hypothetical protein